MRKLLSLFLSFCILFTSIAPSWAQARGNRQRRSAGVSGNTFTLFPQQKTLEQCKELKSATEMALYGVMLPSPVSQKVFNEKYGEWLKSGCLRQWGAFLGGNVGGLVNITGDIGYLDYRLYVSDFNARKEAAAREAARRRQQAEAEKDPVVRGVKHINTMLAKRQANARAAAEEARRRGEATIGPAVSTAQRYVGISRELSLVCKFGQGRGTDKCTFGEVKNSKGQVILQGLTLTKKEWSWAGLRLDLEKIWNKPEWKVGESYDRVTGQNYPNGEVLGNSVDIVRNIEQYGVAYQDEGKARAHLITMLKRQGLCEDNRSYWKSRSFSELEQQRKKNAAEFEFAQRVSPLCGFSLEVMEGLAVIAAQYKDGKAEQGIADFMAAKHRGAFGGMIVAQGVAMLMGIATGTSYAKMRSFLENHAKPSTGENILNVLSYISLEGVGSGLEEAATSGKYLNDYTERFGYLDDVKAREYNPNLDIGIVTKQSFTPGWTYQLPMGNVYEDIGEMLAMDLVNGYTKTVGKKILAGSYATPLKVGLLVGNEGKFAVYAYGKDKAAQYWKGLLVTDFTDMNEGTQRRMKERAAVALYKNGYFTAEQAKKYGMKDEGKFTRYRQMGKAKSVLGGLDLVIMVVCLPALIRGLASGGMKIMSKIGKIRGFAKASKPATKAATTSTRGLANTASRGSRGASTATKPATTKPAATKPAATKPATTKPAATKPAAPKTSGGSSAGAAGRSSSGAAASQEGVAQAAGGGAASVGSAASRTGAEHKAPAKAAALPEKTGLKVREVRVLENGMAEVTVETPKAVLEAGLTTEETTVIKTLNTTEAMGRGLAEQQSLWARQVETLNQLDNLKFIEIEGIRVYDLPDGTKAMLPVEALARAEAAAGLKLTASAPGAGRFAGVGEAVSGSVGSGPKVAPAVVEGGSAAGGASAPKTFVLSSSGKPISGRIGGPVEVGPKPSFGRMLIDRVKWDWSLFKIEVKDMASQTMHVLRTKTGAAVLALSMNMTPVPATAVDAAMGAVNGVVKTEQVVSGASGAVRELSAVEQAFSMVEQGARARNLVQVGRGMKAVSNLTFADRLEHAAVTAARTASAAEKGSRVPVALAGFVPAVATPGEIRQFGRFWDKARGSSYIPGVNMLKETAKDYLKDMTRFEQASLINAVSAIDVSQASPVEISRIIVQSSTQFSESAVREAKNVLAFNEHSGRVARFLSGNVGVQMAYDRAGYPITGKIQTAIANVRDAVYVNVVAPIQLRNNPYYQAFQTAKKAVSAPVSGAGQTIQTALGSNLLKVDGRLNAAAVRKYVRQAVQAHMPRSTSGVLSMNGLGALATLLQRARENRRLAAVADVVSAALTQAYDNAGVRLQYMPSDAGIDVKALLTEEMTAALASVSAPEKTKKTILESLPEILSPGLSKQAGLSVIDENSPIENYLSGVRSEALLKETLPTEKMSGLANFYRGMVMFGLDKIRNILENGLQVGIGSSTPNAIYASNSFDVAVEYSHKAPGVPTAYRSAFERHYDQHAIPVIVGMSVSDLQKGVSATGFGDVLYKAWPENLPASQLRFVAAHMTVDGKEGWYRLSLVDGQMTATPFTENSVRPLKQETTAQSSSSSVESSAGYLYSGIPVMGIAKMLSKAYKAIKRWFAARRAASVVPALSRPGTVLARVEAGIPILSVSSLKAGLQRAVYKSMSLRIPLLSKWRAHKRAVSYADKVQEIATRARYQALVAFVKGNGRRFHLLNQNDSFRDLYQVFFSKGLAESGLPEEVKLSAENQFKKMLGNWLYSSPSSKTTHASFSSPTGTILVPVYRQGKPIGKVEIEQDGRFKIQPHQSVYIEAVSDVLGEMYLQEYTEASDGTTKAEKKLIRSDIPLQLSSRKSVASSFGLKKITEGLLMINNRIWPMFGLYLLAGMSNVSSVVSTFSKETFAMSNMDMYLMGGVSSVAMGVMSLFVGIWQDRLSYTKKGYNDRRGRLIMTNLGLVSAILSFSLPWLLGGMGGELGAPELWKKNVLVVSFLLLGISGAFLDVAMKPTLLAVSHRADYSGRVGYLSVFKQTVGNVSNYVVPPIAMGLAVAFGGFCDWTIFFPLYTIGSLGIASAYNLFKMHEQTLVETENPSRKEALSITKMFKELVGHEKRKKLVRRGVLATAFHGANMSIFGLFVNSTVQAHFPQFKMSDMYAAAEGVSGFDGVISAVWNVMSNSWLGYSMLLFTVPIIVGRFIGTGLTKHELKLPGLTIPKQNSGNLLRLSVIGVLLGIIAVNLPMWWMNATGIVLLGLGLTNISPIIGAYTTDNSRHASNAVSALLSASTLLSFGISTVFGLLLDLCVPGSVGFLAFSLPVLMLFYLHTFGKDISTGRLLDKENTSATTQEEVPEAQDDDLNIDDALPN